MKNFCNDLYVDEAIRYLPIVDLPIVLDKYQQSITAIGAGVGIKEDKVKLLDWCGLVYYSTYNKSNGKNGNGHWSLLGNLCLKMIRENARIFKPEKIYTCNQIAFYILKAMLVNGMPSKNLKFLAYKIKPVTQKIYRNENGVYKTKQEVGKLARKNLKIEVNADFVYKLLEGRLYDIKSKEFIDL